MDETGQVRTRRALLFTPGDDRAKIEKGAALDVDAVILEMEDGVALSNKAAARETVAAALREVDFGRSERLVRINPISTAFWRADLDVTAPSRPDTYIIPKVEHAEHVRRVGMRLAEIEAEQGWPEGTIGLIALIETALAVVNLKEIASSSPRLTALAFGAEDMAGDLGALRTPDGWEVFYARSAVVLHARAYGLQAIDTPFVDLTADDSSLITDTEQAHYMGFTGKFAIHPRQVGPIQRVFTPTEAQVQRAQALIEAHEAQQAAGVGVFAFEGKMVDMPMVRAAEQILARARAAGMVF
ncbi:MAG: CoA ester lyase [Anaerolineae bacterium]